MGISSLGGEASGIPIFSDKPISQAKGPAGAQDSIAQSTGKLDQQAIEDILAMLPQPWIDMLTSTSVWNNLDLTMGLVSIADNKRTTDGAVNAQEAAIIFAALNAWSKDLEAQAQLNQIQAIKDVIGKDPSNPLVVAIESYILAHALQTGTSNTETTHTKENASKQSVDGTTTVPATTPSQTLPTLQPADVATTAQFFKDSPLLISPLSSVDSELLVKAYQIAEAKIVLGMLDMFSNAQAAIREQQREQDYQDMILGRTPYQRMMSDYIASIQSGDQTLSQPVVSMLLAGVFTGAIVTSTVTVDPVTHKIAFDAVPKPQLPDMATTAAVSPAAMTTSTIPVAPDASIVSGIPTSPDTVTPVDSTSTTAPITPTDGHIASTAAVDPNAVIPITVNMTAAVNPNITSPIVADISIGPNTQAHVLTPAESPLDTTLAVLPVGQQPIADFINDLSKTLPASFQSALPQLGLEMVQISAAVMISAAYWSIPGAISMTTIQNPNDPRATTKSAAQSFALTVAKFVTSDDFDQFVKSRILKYVPSMSEAQFTIFSNTLKVVMLACALAALEKATMTKCTGEDLIKLLSGNVPLAEGDPRISFVKMIQDLLKKLPASVRKELILSLSSYLNYMPNIESLYEPTEIFLKMWNPRFLRDAPLQQSA